MMYMPALSLATACTTGNASEFRRISQLRCIVTGMENSGTTILSELIENAPGILGGFECGVLLAPEPRRLDAVVPFYKWLSRPVEEVQWGIPAADLDVLRSEAACHKDLYAGLRRLSPLMRNATEILDKTPRYIYELTTIVERAPGIPVVVIHKEKPDQLASWAKRGVTGDQAVRRYDVALASFEKAYAEYPDRILPVNYTDLIGDPDSTMRRVFGFVNLSWDPAYATMASLNAKLAPFGAKPRAPLKSAGSER